MPSRILNEREEAILRGLDEPFQTHAKRAFYILNKRIADHKDIYAVVRDGYRTYEEQMALYAVGRAQLKDGAWVRTRGKILTKALPEVAPHCYRRAVHLFLLEDLGKPGANVEDRLLPDRDGRWQFVGTAAMEAGVAWGGNWRTFKDLGHIESKDWADFARRRQNRPLGPSERGDG